MENGDSRYTSSKEDEQKQSSPRKSPIPSEPVGKITYVKFLLSNAEAGSVIGKRGSTISDFQTQSGARIQLSRNFELFPGTPDRIIMVSGTIEDVLKGVDLILAKLLDEFYVDNNNGETAPRSRVRLVVPNLCCGGIIGKAGSIIKTFIEHSHAVIKISSPENMYPGLRDRLVTLIGTLEEQMQAIELILEKLSEDTNYLQSINAPFAYPASGYNQMGGAYNGMPGYNGPNYPPNGIAGKFQNNRLPIKEERTSSATIGVADEHIGLVVGRGGRNLTDISQISGARIKISNRGDFMTGTNDRKVTITGSQSAIRVAEAMIAQKVTSASRGDDVGEVA